MNQTNGLKLLIFFLLLSMQLPAQKVLWEKPLDSELHNVNWIVQSNDGIIVSGGDKGICGLDNHTGEVLWKNSDFKAISGATVRMVDPLPYLVMEYMNMMGKASTLVMETSTGDILFNSREEEMKVMSFDLIPELGGILFQIQKDKIHYLGLLDIAAKEMKWMTEMGKKKGGLKGLVKNALSSGFLKRQPILGANQRLIVAKKKEIYGLDGATGKIAWTMELDDKFKAMEMNEEGDLLFIGVKDKLYIQNVQDGKLATKDPLKLRGKFMSLVPQGDDYFVLSERGFNILNKKTKKLRWEKSDKLLPISQVIPVKDNYIAVFEAEEEGKIFLVDANGKKQWDKGIKGGPVFIGPVKNGVFYISTERANILDFKKGDKAWDKDVKIKGYPAVDFDESTQEVVIYSDKKVNRFDVETGKMNLVAEDVKLEKYDSKEHFSRLEVRKEGYFISSSQHAAFVSRDGKVLYNNYYQPVSSVGGLGKFASLGLGLVSGVYVDIDAVKSDMEELDNVMNGVFVSGENYTSAEKKSSNAFAMEVNGVTVMQATKDRFYATKQEKDHIFIMAKGEAKGSKQIYVINKDSGDVEQKIDLIDKKPQYIIDNYDNRVFVKEKRKSVKCLDLN